MEIFKKVFNKQFKSYILKNHFNNFRYNKLMERFLYYWAKIYSSNLQIGDKYADT